MALRLRGSKDVKKSFYYVWYLGAREAKGVDAMPSAIAYLLERERLQEPFKVTLQVSGIILKSGFGGAHRKISRKRIDDDPCDQPTETHVDTRVVSFSLLLFPLFLFPACVRTRDSESGCRRTENKQSYNLTPQPQASLDGFSRPVDCGGTNEVPTRFDGALVHFRNVGNFRLNVRLERDALTPMERARSQYKLRKRKKSTIQHDLTVPVKRSLGCP